jgi:hypothetical protein
MERAGSVSNPSAILRRSSTVTSAIRASYHYLDVRSILLNERSKTRLGRPHDYPAGRTARVPSNHDVLSPESAISSLRATVLRIDARSNPSRAVSHIPF